MAGSGTATLGTGSSINADISSSGGQSTRETPTGISNEGSSYVSPDGKRTSMAKIEVRIKLGGTIGTSSDDLANSSALQILDYSMASQVNEKDAQPITRADTSIPAPSKHILG